MHSGARGPIHAAHIKTWIETNLTTAKGADWGFKIGAVVSDLSTVLQFWPHAQTVESMGGGYWAALPVMMCLSLVMGGGLGSYLLGIVFALLRFLLSVLAAGELTDDPSGDYFDDIPWT